MAHHVTSRRKAGAASRRLRAACAGTALAIVSLILPGVSAAAPPMALALRAGTPGVGLDLDFGLSPEWGVRVGYSVFDLDHSIATSDVHYNGRLKLGMATALLDWYPFRGMFHLTAGVVDDRTRLDVVGRPSQGAYTLNGNTYTSAQVGSLVGRARFAQSVAPYLGVGWGNPTALDGHVHFLFDIGAVYGGAVQVALAAQCGPAAPAGSAACMSAQSDVAAERLKLQHKLNVVHWYPMVSLGVAVRF